MSLNFRCALVTGGGGGIGKAIAQYFISTGRTVLLAGRTESNLRSTAEELGAAGYYVLDVSNTSAMAGFIAKVTTEHPELDCLVNNAGVQRPLQVLETDDFLDKADLEIDTNIRGPMHLTLGLLPHLQTKANPLVVNISSVLGFVPTSIINPVYNGTKAWLHFWTMNLRTQLRSRGSSVRVVEIAPPSVGTDLHRERENPDDNKKANNPQALTVEEFMKEVIGKLENGDEVISAGPGNEAVRKWYAAFGDDYSAAEG